jgi:hypothetical protein
VVQVLTATFAPVTADPEASRRLYIDALGLPREHAAWDDYIHSEAIGGSRHFRRVATGSSRSSLLRPCELARHHTRPAGVRGVRARGRRRRPKRGRGIARSGPRDAARCALGAMGQTVARLLSSEHIIVGLSYAPWLHT